MRNFYYVKVAYPFATKHLVLVASDFAEAFELAASSCTGAISYDITLCNFLSGSSRNDCDGCDTFPSHRHTCKAL